MLQSSEGKSITHSASLPICIVIKGDSAQQHDVRAKVGCAERGVRPPPHRQHRAAGAALRTRKVGFPGGAVVKNAPANAGDTGSIPGPGRSHMPRSS